MTRKIGKVRVPSTHSDIPQVDRHGETSPEAPVEKKPQNQETG